MRKKLALDFLKVRNRCLGWWHMSLKKVGGEWSLKNGVSTFLKKRRDTISVGKQSVMYLFCHLMKVWTFWSCTTYKISPDVKQKGKTGIFHDHTYSFVLVTWEFPPATWEFKEPELVHPVNITVQDWQVVWKRQGRFEPVCYSNTPVLQRNNTNLTNLEIRHKIKDFFLI